MFHQEEGRCAGHPLGRPAGFGGQRPGFDTGGEGLGFRGKHFRHEFGGRGFGRRGFGGGRERMFDAGEFQLVILHLLAEEPSYGYQLIKRLEERLSGGYAPSPGVVYPTLTMLEEEGFATVSASEDGKKVYTVTAAGQKHLDESKRLVEEVLGRLKEAGRGFQRGRSPQIMKAFMNLRGAVKARVSREGATAEDLAKIAAAIEGAAKAIDAL
jgi:DNA-binding PadR family transcriptional regulator